MKIPEHTQMDADFWRDVERAMQMTPQERVREGCALADRSLRLMTDGLRHQFPSATIEDIVGKVRQRLEIIREVESNVWTPRSQPNAS